MLSRCAYDLWELLEACLTDNYNSALQEVLHFVEEGYVGFLLLLCSNVPIDELLQLCALYHLFVLLLPRGLSHRRLLYSILFFKSGLSFHLFEGRLWSLYTGTLRSCSCCRATY